MEPFFIILVLLIGFYMLWNIGANDVANAIGTSVGSGAITLKRAIIIAAILEFAGAFILGGNVSETIQSGIVDPNLFTGEPMVFVIGMLSALLATALWLQLATYFRWPVSTTHAIVGSIFGFGIVYMGTKAIHWDMVGSIALSWVISPTISAVFAYFVFAFIQKKILFAYSPVHATKKYAPFLVFWTLFVFVLPTILGGNANMQVKFPLYMVLAISSGVGLIGGLICYYFCKKITGTLHLTKSIGAKQEHQLYCLGKARKHLTRAKLAATGGMSAEIDGMTRSLSGIIDKLKEETQFDSQITADYQTVEKVFGYLQILTACFVAFAHGANDVANAIGPVSAVIQVIKSGTTAALSTVIPPWLLLFGGFGIIFGLATYGWRVIETIGHKITQLTPTRGFAAEFSAAVTILVASKIGMPISTTHSIVGAVLGVGLARGISALNFRMIRGIFMSWIITLPCSAAASIIIFYIFKLIFL